METTSDTPIETVSEDCPEQAIDAEIAKIANEKQCAYDDLGTAGDVPDMTFGDAGQEEGVEM
jgi:hypothetical protein